MGAPLKRSSPPKASMATDLSWEDCDPWEAFLPRVAEALSAAARRAGAEIPAAELRGQLEWGNSEQADVAFPAHRLARTVGQDARELALRIARNVPSTVGVDRVESTGAFVNVTLDAERFIDRTLTIIRDRGARYGGGPARPGVSCIEHTSANPTGPFHIGRVRNAILGDTLARAARASGEKVVTQYYADDLGRQSAMITWIWSKPIDRWPEAIRAALPNGAEATEEKPDRRLGRPYPLVSQYVKNHPEAAEEVGRLVQDLEGGRAPPTHRQLAEEILRGMCASLRRLGIEFDEFVWESSLLADGSVEAVVQRLKAAPHAVREANGAWAIDASGYGLPKESPRIIFLRHDGTTLYTTRDVAYHLEKFRRFDRVVDVLGQDHRLHARTLDALLAEIGEGRRPEYLIYQDLVLPGGGRMSTRGGSAVWLDDLLDEAVKRARDEVRRRRTDLADDALDAIAQAVGAGAVRYHILRVAPDKPVQFRWEEALSFEGRAGPFLQYAYARAASILRKSGVARAVGRWTASDLLGVEERALVKILSRLPSLVAHAARSGQVHSLAGFAHDIADRFNRFYHAVPVLGSGDKEASRLALVEATYQTLGNTLDLIGVPRLETM